MNEFVNAESAAEETLEQPRQPEAEDTQETAQPYVCDGVDSWHMSADFGQLNWGEGGWGRCSC